MASPASPRPANRLFTLTLAVTTLGLFLGIMLLFSDIPLSVRVVTALMVGVVGVISFIRHSLYFRSDQVRMGWMQDHPQFQIEVGFANLAFGIPALLASFFDWGLAACGVILLAYGIYMLCTAVLHVEDVLHDLHGHKGASMRIATTAFFAIALLAFASLALYEGGLFGV